MAGVVEDASAENKNRHHRNWQTTITKPPNVPSYTGCFLNVVASITAQIASGWSGCRVGLWPTGKTPPLHGSRQN